MSSAGEKKEEIQLPPKKRKTMTEMAPLPLKRESTRTRRPAKKVSTDLTSDQHLQYVGEKEGEEQKKSKKGAKGDKKPRVVTTFEKIGGVDVEFLGGGPTKLAIYNGQEGMRCSMCQQPWHSFDAG